MSGVEFDRAKFRELEEALRSILPVENFNVFLRRLGITLIDYTATFRDVEKVKNLPFVEISEKVKFPKAWITVNPPVERTALATVIHQVVTMGQGTLTLEDVTTITLNMFDNIIGGWYKQKVQRVYTARRKIRKVLDYLLKEGVIFLESNRWVWPATDRLEDYVAVALMETAKQSIGAIFGGLKGTLVAAVVSHYGFQEENLLKQKVFGKTVNIGGRKVTFGRDVEKHFDMFVKTNLINRVERSGEWFLVDARLKHLFPFMKRLEELGYGELVDWVKAIVMWQPVLTTQQVRNATVIFIDDVEKRSEVMTLFENCVKEAIKEGLYMQRGDLLIPNKVIAKLVEHMHPIAFEVIEELVNTLTPLPRMTIREYFEHLAKIDRVIEKILSRVRVGVDMNVVTRDAEDEFERMAMFKVLTLLTKWGVIEVDNLGKITSVKEEIVRSIGRLWGLVYG